jgi:hypothetical protein
MKGIGRLSMAVSAALIALALGPLAPADAAGPNIVIESPTANSRSNQPAPLVSGSTDDTLDPVSMSIYEGQIASGTPVFSETTQPVGTGWSVQSSPLAEGTYTAVAGQVSSITSEPGLSQPVTFTIDEAGPAVSLNPVASPTKAPSFGGGAGSAAGDLPTVTVTVRNSAEAVVASVPTQASGGAWSYTPGSLPDGAYTVQATQSDEAGNTATSATRSFTVDTTSPSVSINPVASPTSDNTPTFGGSLGTAAGDQPAVVVTVRSSPAGTVEKTGSASVSGSSWSYTPSSLPDGAYTVQATQLDSAGNQGLSAAPTFTVDTSKPKPSLLQPTSPSQNRTPTFNWNAGTAPRDLPLVKVKVLSAGKVVREGSSSSGSWTVAEPLEADGTFTVQIEQSDEAGNTGTDSKTFTIDNTKPAVSFGSPGEGAHLKNPKPDLSGNAGNASGDEQALTLNIYQGSETTGTPEAIPIKRSGGSWSESEGPNLADGTYTAQILQRDAAGNLGEAKRTFTIETNTPHVTLNALPSFTKDTTPSFSGSVDTTKGVVESVTLKVFRGSSVAESAELAEPPIVVSASGSTWSTGATEHLPDGTYTAQAEQENLAGTPGFSGHATFTVDTHAPQPTLSAPGPSMGTETLGGIAGNAPGDRGEITVELFQGSAATPGEAFEVLTVKRTGASWSATFAGLGGGEYTALARQADEAGNAGESAPASFTVVVPPPPPVVTPPSPSPPVASFAWVPASPTVGQSVSLVSNSTDASSAIGAFAWDLAGNGPFAAGGPAITTTFATAGAHVVRLQVADGNGLSSTVAETIAVAAPALKLMQPFPIVRIAGSETGSGVRVKLLTVQAPAGTTVTVSCKGHGCKTKSESRVAKASSKSASKSGAITLAFPRFERSLRSGAVLQIRVSKPGEIGKYTSFTIRRRKLPVRVDACLRPPSTSPSPCPST